MITPGVCINLYTLVKTSHGTDKLFDRLNVLKFANIEEVEQKFFSSRKHLLQPHAWKDKQLLPTSTIKLSTRIYRRRHKLKGHNPFEDNPWRKIDV